jgi:hypothetical protein
MTVVLIASGGVIPRANVLLNLKNEYHVNLVWMHLLLALTTCLFQV